jgi:hypothetical protein
MAYFDLVHHTTFEEATRIAAEYKGKGAIVSVRQHNGMAPRKVRPIVERVFNNGTWLNYYEDNTHTKSYPDRNTKRCLGYAPYLPAPDRLKLDEFEMFCWNELMPLKGKGYETFLLYLSQDEEEVLYSVHDGVLQTDIKLRVANNPMIFFEMGGCRHTPSKTGRSGKRGKGGTVEALPYNPDAVIDAGD